MNKVNKFVSFVYNLTMKVLLYVENFVWGGGGIIWVNDGAKDQKKARQEQTYFWVESRVAEWWQARYLEDLLNSNGLSLIQVKDEFGSCIIWKRSRGYIIIRRENLRQILHHMIDTSYNKYSKKSQINTKSKKKK